MAKARTGHREEKREVALAALITCPSIETAAKKAGIGKSTMYALLREPDFKAEYERRNRKILDDACDAVLHGVQDAVDTLWEVCRDPEQPGQTRVQASRAILEYAIKLKEDVDWEHRIKTLEENAGVGSAADQDQSAGVEDESRSKEEN